MRRHLGTLHQHEAPDPRGGAKVQWLWMAGQTFREMKTVLDNRPIYHRWDVAISGHVFCSFLALALKKELDFRLASNGLKFQWADIKQDP